MNTIRSFALFAAATLSGIGLFAGLSGTVAAQPEQTVNVEASQPAPVVHRGPVLGRGGWVRCNENRSRCD